MMLVSCEASFTPPEENGGNTQPLWFYTKANQTITINGDIDFHGNPASGTIVVAWEVPSIGGYIIYGTTGIISGAGMPKFTAKIPDSLPLGIMRGNTTGDTIAVGH